MPFGELPTSGGGLRCWHLKKGLEAHGIEVLSSMPAFTFLAEKHWDKIPKEQKELLWHWETQDEILERTKPDAVVFASNWDHYGLSKKPDVPLIIDLHGSRLIETTMWNAPVSTERKVTVLSLADCLLTAGTRQRLYFYGWLLQAGRVPENEHFIRYIPISLDPELPEHNYPNEPTIVSGGGWFPWQNQANAIFLSCKKIEDTNMGSIEIYGTPHETQSLSAEEQAIREVFSKVKSLSENNPRINVHGYIGRTDLLEVYKNASVALEVMRYNLERELAFTTRTIEYLWCGLPVIYNHFGEIAGHIRDYDAGWTVDPEKPEQMQSALDEIFSNPALVAKKGRNAQALVKDRFSWDKTILPLVDYLNNPKKQPISEPILGAARARPSFLSPKGASLLIPISANAAPLCQKFIVPAEEIKALEIPISISSEDGVKNISRVTIQVERLNGKVLTRKELLPTELSKSSKVLIEFPLLKRPEGGEELVFSISAKAISDASSDTPAICLRGLLNAKYPFIPSDVASFSALDSIGNKVQAQCIAFSFLPSQSPWYRVRVLFSRAIVMAKRGEWRRIVRAGMKRVPKVVEKVKSMASV